MLRSAILLVICLILTTPPLFSQSRQDLPCSDPQSQPDSCPIITPVDALTALTHRPELAGRGFAFALAEVLRTELATFPLESSSGGFTWTFDSSLGLPTRTSQSYGPQFAERPLTNGNKKLNVGVAFQRTSFESVTGIPLDSLEIDDDLPRGASIHLSSERTIISASYGITDRLDVGLVVPFGRTLVQGSSYRTVFALDGRLANTRRLSTSVDESPFGFGDVVVRGKLKLISLHSANHRPDESGSTSRLDLAAGLDIRLPTGSKQDLLGLGRRQIKAILLGGLSLGKVAPHFNLGYTFGGPGINSDLRAVGTNLSNAFNPSNEINLIIGADAAITPRVTLIGDVVGRRLPRSASFRFRPYESIFGPSGIYEVIPGPVDALLGTVGTKINVTGSWLITSSVLFPLNDGAARPRPTVVLGLEHGF